MSHAARLIAMLATPLSIIILSVPLSSIYSKYISLRKDFQVQLSTSKNVRYVIYDEKSYKKFSSDVTEHIQNNLEHLRFNRLINSLVTKLRSITF